jgi:hypothetical protein
MPAKKATRATTAANTVAATNAGCTTRAVPARVAR